MTHKKNKQPAPVALRWHYASQGPSENETPGAHWGTPSNPVPTPDEVESYQLRAWFACSRCNRLRPTPKGYGKPWYVGAVGYGRRADTGEVACYACCAEQDKIDMRTAGRAVLYLTRAPDAPTMLQRERMTLPMDWRVTNWPGSLSLFVYALKFNRHNWRNVERVDFWFIFEGHVWHGIRLGDMDCARVRRTRTEWRLLPSGEGGQHWGEYTPRKSRAKAKPAPSN